MMSFRQLDHIISGQSRYTILILMRLTPEIFFLSVRITKCLADNYCSMEA